MTTKLTVNPETNGTLKQNRSFTNRLMRLTASLALAVIAFTAMSFTQEDTTKKEETRNMSRQSTTSNDSCCTITFVNGIQNIVITNKNAFTADVRINNMDINTWVNSMMAYSYKRINISSIGMADIKMDVNFKKTETLDRKMAVAFGKTLKNETLEADAELSEYFTQTVAAPLFGKMMNVEAVYADALIDNTMRDDSENRMKAAQFSKAIILEKERADGEMDYMMNASTLKNFQPVNALNADQKLDDFINKSTFKNFLPANAQSADKGMDELLKNKQ